MSLCTEIFEALACLRRSKSSGEGGVGYYDKSFKKIGWLKTRNDDDDNDENSDECDNDITWVEDNVWYESLWASGTEDEDDFTLSGYSANTEAVIHY